jgi:hypothetical protein
MTRLITLRLGATTDERHCGDCPYGPDKKWCAPFQDYRELAEVAPGDWKQPPHLRLSSQGTGAPFLLGHIGGFQPAHLSHEVSQVAHVDGERPATGPGGSEGDQVRFDAGHQFVQSVGHSRALAA